MNTRLESWISSPKMSPREIGFHARNKIMGKINNVDVLFTLIQKSSK